MKTIYTEKFIENTLFSLESEIKDLSEWSAHNDDKINMEIKLLKSTLKQIKENV